MNQLDQLRSHCEMALALSGAKVRKNFQTFFIQTMIIYATTFNRINFSQMGRLSSPGKQRYRQNFEKDFDWIAFNRQFLSILPLRRFAIAIDPSYISKSGKHTPGLACFWSGAAGMAKRGLEILGISVVDADSKDAVALCARQTFSGKVSRGRRPDCLKWCKGNSSLYEQSLRTIHGDKNKYLQICRLFVADAYFSVYPFVQGLSSMGFDLVSRLHDNASLRYLYEGERTGKRGRPVKYGGKVDVGNLDESVFTKETATTGNGVEVVLQSAVVNYKSLKREIKLVVATFQEEGKKTQIRKMFFSTDTGMKAVDIFDIYRTRFQEEFLFRDAKGLMGLEHCQARSEKKLDFAFNMSLSTVNMLKLLAHEMEKEHHVKYSVEDMKIMLHNIALYEEVKLFNGVANKRTAPTYLETMFDIPLHILMFGVKNSA